MYDKFFTYLCGLDTNFSKLAELLSEKLVALDRFDPDRLDEIIKEEQAYVLQSRGFDGTIKNHRKELKLEGETLGEIIGRLPENEQQRFNDIFAKLSTSLGVAKGLNDKCQFLIENRLHSIGKAIRDLDSSNGTIYGDMKASGDAPKLMNKSI